MSNLVDGIDVKRYRKSDVVLFNSYSKTTEVLSNHHACDLIVDGHTFKSVEHLFYCMHLSDFPLYQKEIMKCEDAKAVKRLGDRYFKKIGIVDDPKVDIPYLRFCQQVKYLQCPEFRYSLEKSGNKPLVEYAWWGDNGYGVVDIDPSLKYNWYKGDVEGQNICGRIMMGVRKHGREGTLSPIIPNGVKLLGEELDLWGN